MRVYGTPRLTSARLWLGSCISVGTRRGFSIYNCEPFGKVFQEEIGGVGVAEMLYCTSLVALVGAGEQVRSALAWLGSAWLDSESNPSTDGLTEPLPLSMSRSQPSRRGACACGTPRRARPSAT